MTHLIKLIILLLNSSVTTKASATETVGTLRLYLPNTCRVKSVVLSLSTRRRYSAGKKIKKSLFGQRLKIED